MRTPEVDGVQGLAALEVAERVITSVREHSWDGENGIANWSACSSDSVQSAREAA